MTRSDNKTELSSGTPIASGSNHQPFHKNIAEESSTSTFTSSSSSSVEEINRRFSTATPTTTNKSQSSLLLFLLGTLYLTYFAAEGSLLPFLPIYYHSLGHGGVIIGVLGAATPLTTFLVAPLWGRWSDQSGQPIRILYGTMFLSMIGQILVVVSDDPRYIMSMLCIRSIFSSAVKPLIDSVVMEELTRQEQAHNFGKIRLWSMVSTGLVMSLAGQLIDGTEQQQQQQQTLNWNNTSGWDEVILVLWQGLTGYKLLFLLHGLLHIPTFICLRAVEKRRTNNNNHNKRDDPPSQVTGGSSTRSKEPTKKSPPRPPPGMSSPPDPPSSVSVLSMIQKVERLLEQDSKVTFFFLIFLMGVSASVCETFAYVRIQEVGGTARIMGLSRLFCSLAGAPTFFFNGRLLQRQHMNTQPHLVVNRILTFCFLCHTVRFAIFVCMGHPYWSFVAEGLRGLIFAIFWATCTVYVSNHLDTPPGGGRATMLMLLNACYNGIGRTVGSLVAGKLQAHVGTADTFIYVGMMTLTVTVLLSIRPVRPIANSTGSTGEEHEPSHTQKSPTEHNISVKREKIL